VLRVGEFRCHCARARQIEPHRRARTDRAVDGRHAARPFAEREHLRQAQPRAHAFGLGGEQRFERAAEDLGTHARARVLQRQLHEFADERKPVLVAKVHVVRANRKRAAARHGVAGVHGHVDQRKLEFGCIDANRPQVAIRLEIQRDLRAERSLQQLATCRQPFADRDGLVAQRLLAGDAQQLARERLTAFKRAFHGRQLAIQSRSAASPDNLDVG